MAPGAGARTAVVAPTGDLESITEFLALQDAAALSAILPELYHSDESVRRYVAASLAMFDGAVLTKQLTPMVKEKAVTEEFTRETSRDSKNLLKNPV